MRHDGLLLFSLFAIVALIAGAGIAVGGFLGGLILGLWLGAGVGLVVAGLLGAAKGRDPPGSRRAHGHR